MQVSWSDCWSCCALEITFDEKDEKLHVYVFAFDSKMHGVICSVFNGRFAISAS